jgi:hypothetical protein
LVSREPRKLRAGFLVSRANRAGQALDRLDRQAARSSARTSKERVSSCRVQDSRPGRPICVSCGTGCTKGRVVISEDSNAELLLRRKHRETLQPSILDQIIICALSESRQICAMNVPMKNLPGCGTCCIWNGRNGTKHGTCGMDGSITTHVDRCAFHQKIHNTSEIRGSSGASRLETR